jgi:predicted porin
MKFKTTAIAMAVAGIVAAPVVAQAAADEIYASARIGVWQKDTGGQSELDIRSFSSRFGAKGEADLGNGMTGFGRYEWDVDLGEGGGLGVRHRYVGLKGDFGSVLVGQTYQTFYNFAVGPNDIPWWHSGYAMVSYRGRTDNAITYAGSRDKINFGATIYLRDDPDEDDIDATEWGVSFAIADMTLGLAAATSENAAQGSDKSDDAIYAAVLNGVTIGDVGLGFGVQSQNDDMSALAQVDIGNIYVHVEYLSIDKDSGSASNGNSRDVVGTTLGYTQSLGRKTTMYYELFYQDNDTGDSDDDVTSVMAVLKYDII